MGLRSFIKSIFGGSDNTTPTQGQTTAQTPVKRPTAVPKKSSYTIGIAKPGSKYTGNSTMPTNNRRIPTRTDDSTKNVINLKKNIDLFNTICLKKKVDPKITARVALVLDFSGSMDHLYANGSVQALVEKLLPVGVKFDDNEAIDIFIFSHGTCHEFTGEISPAEFEGYVDREIYSKYDFGGTYYAPVMHNIINKYTAEEGEPAFVMFVTDGDCSDDDKALKTISMAAECGIFWQFIGIGKSSFRTLESLDTMKGRVIDNANFFNATDIHNMKEEDLYERLMEEFPLWHKEALAKGIISLD